MENENKDQEKHQDAKPSGKDKIANFINKATKVVTDVSKAVVERTKEEIEKIKDSMAFRKAFEAETYEFIVEGTNYSFRGFKKHDENLVYFRTEEDDLLKYVKEKSILVKRPEDMRLVVVSIETNEVKHGTIKVDGEDIPISLCKIVTKPFDKNQEVKIVNDISDSVKIKDSAALEIRLNEFEDILKGFTPGFFQRGNYNDAVKLYPEVKKVVIANDKDSKVLKLFVELLDKVNPTLLKSFLIKIK